jgi:hypothetical protein
VASLQYGLWTWKALKWDHVQTPAFALDAAPFKFYDYQFPEPLKTLPAHTAPQRPDLHPHPNLARKHCSPLLRLPSTPFTRTIAPAFHLAITEPIVTPLSP